jgi:galactosyl transferase GMA12/MNN10 family
MSTTIPGPMGQQLASGPIAPPDMSTLEQWWLNGAWSALVEADKESADRFGDQATVLLFFAVAHLQTGTVNKARLLLQKALDLGTPRDIASQALLAASVEKLAMAARIQSENSSLNTSQAPSNDSHDIEASALRSKVLDSLRAADAQPQATEPNKAIQATFHALSGVMSKAASPAYAQRSPSAHSGHHGRIGVLSGYYPGTRFNSPVNHRLYARQHGYRYIFDSTPRFDKRTYMRKLEAILEYLDLFDWLFWIDDDAYFTDFSVPLERFIDMAPESDFIVCKSPSTKETFTRISSGQFLLRNTPVARRFIEDALATDLREVQKWWKSHLGMFTKGDQDALVYLLETHATYASPFCSVVDHHHFNSRPFEFAELLNEHFLVHFTGQKKLLDKAQFCQRLHCNEYLCPPDLIDDVALQ